jgi:DNA-binding transcriptional MerR regulator
MMRMVADSNQTYRIGEFAKLSGVSVRALHHYDRLGLLKPSRSPSGYRVYHESDLESVEQIVALKFIGVPLQRISVVRRGGPSAFGQILRAQRATLEEKRRLLDRAIDAIRHAEASIASGAATTVPLIKRVIEVIEMQNHTDEWTSKYEAMQSRIDRLRAMTPEARAELLEKWSALFRDVQEAMDEDPSSAKAQALVKRWVTLFAPLTEDGKQPAIPGPEFYSSVVQSARAWEFIGKALASR